MSARCSHPACTSWASVGSIPPRCRTHASSPHQLAPSQPPARPLPIEQPASVSDANDVAKVLVASSHQSHEVKHSAPDIDDHAVPNDAARAACLSDASLPLSTSASDVDSDSDADADAELPVNAVAGKIENDKAGNGSVLEKRVRVPPSPHKERLKAEKRRDDAGGIKRDGQNKKTSAKSRNKDQGFCDKYARGHCSYPKCKYIHEVCPLGEQCQDTSCRQRRKHQSNPKATASVPIPVARAAVPVARAPVQATLLIDMAWLHHSSSQAGIHVDLPKLSQRLEQQLGCQFMYKGVYTANRPDLADTDRAQLTQRPLIQYLRANHFDVQVFTCKSKSCSRCGVSNFVQPGSVDAALCLGVANAVIAGRPLLVLVAGDGDFAFVIQWMKSQASTNFKFILAVPSRQEGIGVSPDLVAQTDPSSVIEFARWPFVSTPRVVARIPPAPGIRPAPGYLSPHMRNNQVQAQPAIGNAPAAAPIHGPVQNEPGVGDAGAPGNKVFVVGLPSKTSKISLMEAMMRFGAIDDCFVGFDEDGKPKGFGVVTYKSSESVRRAIAASKQYVVDEKKVVIKEFKPKPESAVPAVKAAGDAQAAAAIPVVADPVAQAVADPVAQVVADPVAQAVADPVAQAVADPVAQVVVDPVAQVVAQAAAVPWICQACTFINRLDRASCEMCFTNADASSSESDSWACSICTFKNALDINVCESCDSTRFE